MLTRRILSSSNLSQEVPLPADTANGASIPVETVLSDDVSINEGFTFCSHQEASSEVYDPVDTYELQLSGEADIPGFMGYSSLSFSDDPIMTNSVDNLGSNKTMSKNMPKWTTPVRVSGGVNPPDDGFTWLKYGQKEILGAKFPRAYYRCIHKHAQGCEATKQVQRSDEDPTIFEVTYRGRHTCYQGFTLMLPPSPKTPNQSLEPHTSDQHQQHSHPENPRQHLSATPMGSEPSLMSESPHSLSGSPRSKDSDRDLRDQRENRDGSVKRKSIPRWTKQVRLSPGMGLEGRPEDGFSWRKYGQKDILGAKFPRGYYRCTYTKQGCWARKQVQRSDEDPTIFEVTYCGKHSCNQGSTVVLPPSQQTPVQSREPKHIPDQEQQHSCHQEDLQQQPNIPGPDEWTSTSNNVSVESSMFWRQTPAAPSKGPMFCILQQQHNHNKDQIKSEKVTQEFVPTSLRVKTEEVDLNLFSPRPSFLSSCHLPSTSIKSDDVKGYMFSSLKFRTKPNCHMKELPFSSGAGSMESFEETGGINPVDLSQGEEYRTSLKFLEGQDVKPNCHAKKPLPFALGEKGIIPFCLSQGYGTSLKFWECQDMKLISGRKVKDQSMKSFQQVSLRELVFLEELQYVSWPGNPPRSLPSNVSPKFLIKLNMAHSSAEQLWAGKQPLANLESIDLNHSKLTKIPDLSEAKKLGRLSLRGCQNLVEISSLQNLAKLEYLNLKGCKSLKSLPSMKNSKSLTTFILSGCSNLKQLPRLSPSIKYLYLAGTAIEELPPSIGSLSSLVKLDLKNCARLRILPSSICELESLDYLDISGCLTLLQLL